jgi:Fe-S cluster biogenesis protein NfuA
MNQIDAAIDELRGALDGDGFDLRLGSVEPDGVVRVILEARPGACLDCLVQDEVLLRILDDSIRKKSPDVRQVILEKQGFDRQEASE